jgi:hypothetical protein
MDVGPLLAVNIIDEPLTPSALAATRANKRRK